MKLLIVCLLIIVAVIGSTRGDDIKPSRSQPGKGDKLNDPWPEKAHQTSKTERPCPTIKPEGSYQRNQPDDKPGKPCSVSKPEKLDQFENLNETPYPTSKPEGPDRHNKPNELPCKPKKPDQHNKTDEKPKPHPSCKPGRPDQRNKTDEKSGRSRPGPN